MHKIIYEKNQIDLKLDAKQRNMIESLFVGPVILAELLCKSGDIIGSQESASQFLLRNRQALEPYLSTVDRNLAVDSLRFLLVQWANSTPEQMELKFDRKGSISATNQIYLPLRSLGPLNVADPHSFAQLRAGKRYVPEFCLIRTSPETYAVNLVLSSKHKIGDIPQTKGKAVRGQASEGKHRATFTVASLLKMFDNRCHQSVMQELRLSQQFSAVRYDELSGRPTQGGLPSLGRRR